MARSVWMMVLSMLFVALAACEPSSSSTSAEQPNDGGGTGSPGSTEDTPSNPEPRTPEGTPKVGVVAIDLQKVFFAIANARNPKSNPDERMKRAAHIFELAAQKEVPLFVTFEASKTGEHALPPSLAAALPKDAKEIIKTTFAATGQPSFVPALEASHAKRLIVVGAETDVCILQTMLGLRKRGYEVLALTDALMTEELNNAPALRRMKQAGVVEITMETAETLLNGGVSLPSVRDATAPVIVRPLEIGILLHDIEGLNAADPNASAKTARVRELLMVSEWFKRPVFAVDPVKTQAALPQDLKTILSRPIQKLADRPSTITQLAIAGGHVAIDKLVANAPKGVEMFAVSDAILGATVTELEPFYASEGVVPTTYKTLYYELTQSVNDAEWPSQQWVKDSDPWFNRTSAPEDLPPLALP